MILEPTLLTGTVLGVLLNLWMPSWLMLCMLIVTLGWNTFYTYKKAFSMLADERKTDEQSYELNQADIIENERLLQEETDQLATEEPSDDD